MTFSQLANSKPLHGEFVDFWGYFTPWHALIRFFVDLEFLFKIPQQLKVTNVHVRKLASIAALLLLWLHCKRKRLSTWTNSCVIISYTPTSASPALRLRDTGCNTSTRRATLRHGVQHFDTACNTLTRCALLQNNVYHFRHGVETLRHGVQHSWHCVHYFDTVCSTSFQNNV